MASILRQKKASVDVALRRNRESTYTEPLIKKGEKKDPEDMEDIKAYLSDFYRTIYKRSDECNAILKEHPNTVAVHFAQVVPSKMSYEDFWQRYFYRCDESRLIREWDRAAEKARKARAARAEEIQQSLQKSLRNIQETLEVAATGLTADGTTSGTAAASADGTEPPILGPDAPDTKPIKRKNKDTDKPVADKKEKTVPSGLAALAAKDSEGGTRTPSKDNNKDNTKSVTVDWPVPELTEEIKSGKMSPAPKTAAGEETQEADAKDSSLISPPPVERASEPQSLDDMIAAANEVDRKSPRSKQVRVSPKGEPKVISFWKADSSTDAPSTPKLAKKADATEGEKKEKKKDRRLKKKKDTKTIKDPHLLKRTGSKVTDRVEATSKKRRKDDITTNQDATDINDAAVFLAGNAKTDKVRAIDTVADNAKTDKVRAIDSTTKDTHCSNTFIMGMLIPALLVLLAALLLNSDLTCAAAQPGLELSGEDVFSEAPWWAATSVKKDVFSIVCPSRIRTSVEWTKAGGRGEAIHRLVIRELDRKEGGRPLFDQRNLRMATISPAHISYANKKQRKEKVNAPWLL